MAYASDSSGGIHILDLGDVDLALALGAVAFVLAVVGIAFTVIRRRRGD